MKRFKPSLVKVGYAGCSDAVVGEDRGEFCRNGQVLHECSQFCNANRNLVIPDVITEFGCLFGLLPQLGKLGVDLGLVELEVFDRAHILV